jgi:FAD synthetase
MATGVFDLLHPGHLYFLREARKLGDELWVVVARDSTARRFKHEPITPEASRVQMVEALKPVDRALLGHEGDIYDILDEIRPDIIAIGFDQVHNEERIREECRKRGLATKVVRLPKFEGDLDGTRKIVRKVAEWLALEERLATVEGGDGRSEAAAPTARRRKRKA